MTEEPLLNGSRESSKSGFARTITEVLAFPRTVTDGAFRMFSTQVFDEDAWTTSLIHAYGDVAEKGPKGNIPESEEQAGFASQRVYWSHFMIAIFCGVAMAFIQLGVINCAEEIPKRWTDNGEYNTADDCKLYQGEPYWICIVAGAGLVVGVLTVVLKYPREQPGFFAEVQHCNVDYSEVPSTLLLSTISMGFGASLGPEQALAAAGGGMATYICDKFGKRLGIENEDDRKLAVLIGFVASIAALFPTPLLGFILIVEFTKPPKLYMEYMTLFSVAACANFAVFYKLRGAPVIAYVSALEQNLKLTYAWQFRYKQLYIAVAIGFAAFLVALVNLITVGICKQVFIRLRERIDGLAGNTTLSRILSPVIGGVIIGTMCWVTPLVVGDGSIVLGPIVEYGATGDLTTNLLWCTLFSKMLTMGVSMNCGFVGGFLFPTLVIANIAGVLAFRIINPDGNDPDYPLGFFLSTFLAAVPGAFAPMPLTLILLPTTVFFLGLEQLAPIIVAVTVSYLLFCGSGLFEKLSKAREKKDDDLDQDLLDVKEDDEDGTGDRQVVYKNGRPVLVQAPRRSQPQN